MELFEDLEFKPITEGLGFHRNATTPQPSQTPAPSPKATIAKAPSAPSPKLAPETKSLKPAFVPSLKPEYNFLDEESLTETKKFAQELTQPKVVPDRTKIYDPIGRKEYSTPQLPKSSEAAKTASFSIPVPGAAASLSALRNQTIEKNKATPQQKAAAAPAQPAFALQTKVAAAPAVATSKTLNLGKTRVETLVTCVPAAILDSVFAIGVSLILLVGVLLVTKADLVGLLSNSQTDRFVQVQIAILFAMVLQMYILLSRSTIFGQSIGEWTYDIQLGTDEQKRKALYPVQVVFRSLLFMVTGFVLIPLLSELLGRDLAAPLTGLQLQKTTHEQK